MKYKTILMGLILIATLFSDQSQFKIDGMVCKNGCVYKVNSTVTSIEGVIYADVNFETGILSVEYNPKRVNDDLIIKKITDETTFKIIKKEKELKNKSNWLEKIFSK